MKRLKEIIYKYAELRGGGLPLNAEEVSDCVVQWVQHFVEEQVSNAFNKFVAKSTEVTSRQQVYVKSPDGEQEMVTLSTDFLSYGIPRYNEHGRLTCADPTSAYNVANKRFVEALITELRAEIASLKGK